MQREREEGMRGHGGRRLAIDGRGHLGQGWGKGKRPGLNARVYCLNWPARASKKGKGSGRVRQGSRWLLIGRSRGGGGNEGEGIETDRWVQHVSERKEKEKGTAGMGCYGEGKGKRGKFSFF
jgi:hypothetical protein